MIIQNYVFKIIYILLFENLFYKKYFLDSPL